MSNYSNKEATEELFEVKFDAGKHSKRPKGTYTLDGNGEVLRSVPDGHPSGRAVDPNFPSRTTDPRPGISGVQATDTRPGTTGVHASTKDFKKSKATSDLKSGPEIATQSVSIFSNPSVFQTSVLRAGSNAVVGKLQRDSTPLVDDVAPVTDHSKASKKKKKANIDRDLPSPAPYDYLSEADHILHELEEFDHTCETKCRPSISNPSHGSIELIGHSKRLAGQSTTSFEDKHSSSDDIDSNINVDELLAPNLDDTDQSNQKKVADTAESSAATANPPQVEKISARLKKMRREMRDSDPQANQNTVMDTQEPPMVTEKRPQVEKISERLKKIRREMRDPDPQKTVNLAEKEEVRDHFKVPKQRSKKKKQWEVIETDHFIEETEPISSLENNKERPRPDTPLPSASYVSNSPSALKELAAMHRAQPPAVLANRKKMKYTHGNIIPTLPSRHSPSPPTALDEFAASHKSLPHPLLANKKKLTYSQDNVIPMLPTRPSPSPPTALDEFAASHKALPHPLLANKKKLTYSQDNVIPMLPTRPSPSPPTALDEFAASHKALPHPLLANKKKLTYSQDNVIPMLPTRPSPSPPTALDEFAASHKALPHPLLANKKKLTYSRDNVIPTLPSRYSPSPPTAFDEFVASHKSLPHPLLANQKKLTYSRDNVIPTLPSRPSPSPPSALDEFAASHKDLPHPLLANQKKLTYSRDNVIPILPSRPSPTPPTALDEFAASHQSLPHPLLANQKKLTYTQDNVIPTLPSRQSPSPPTALDEFAAKFPAQHPSQSNASLSTNSSHSSISLYEEVAVIHCNRKQTREPDSRSMATEKPARLPPLKKDRSMPPKKPARNKPPEKPASEKPPNKPARTKPHEKPAPQKPLKNASQEILYDIFGRELDDPTKTLHMPGRMPDFDNSRKQSKSATDETCSTSKDDDERQPARNALSLPQTNIVFQGHASSEPQGPILNIRHIMLDTREKKKKKSCIKKLIPCLKKSEEEEEKYENFDSIETVEYLQVNDAESSPPKVIKNGLGSRILSFFSSLIGRH